ncbi:MAG: hypothetical protein FWD01_05455, partial [Defluviitaleaceae bacterium]|nr:hypothetical protein [Defluviitaleaceae bacterium]
KTAGLENKAFLDKFKGVDAAVIIFPLYVDGIPSHLLRQLYEAKDELRGISPNIRIYAVANNGFYEGKQNALALNMIEHFCDAAGVKWGQGLGIGAGGMLKASQIGVGPLKNVGVTLKTLAANINENISDDNLFTQPNFPKLLYKMGAHFHWKQAAKKNGVKRKALYDRH